MPGNRYDGYTLAAVITAIEQKIGVSLTRIITDKGNRGHNAPPGRRRSIYISGQRRGVTAVIRRELRRKAAVVPVIGHVKTEHRMGRNFLVGHAGDAANAILAAVGHNFRRRLAWLAALLCLLFCLPQSVRPCDRRSSRATNVSSRVI